MSETSVLSVAEVTKSFKTSHGELTVLRDISFELRVGETCAIVGPSGSGKTTLLGLCAGLDQLETGSISLCGQRLNDLSQDEAAKLRNQSVGFVFQSFRLIPTLTAVENVMIPAELAGERNSAKRAEALLESVGLRERLSHYPSQLSGGEQQRVAVARAFINNPRILFADEPTGNLDYETGEAVTKLLLDLNREAGTTLLIVTHNMDLARRTERIIRLEAGAVVSDEPVKETVPS